MREMGGTVLPTSDYFFRCSSKSVQRFQPIVRAMETCTVNRISRDPLLARLGDFFAVRLAALSVPLPSPAEKLWPPYFLGRRGEGDGEQCQPDSEEIPRPR